jgi:hypothetical protein
MRLFPEHRTTATSLSSHTHAQSYECRLCSHCRDKTADVDCTGRASGPRAVVTTRLSYTGFSHCGIILKWIIDRQWVKVLTAKLDEDRSRDGLL